MMKILEEYFEQTISVKMLQDFSRMVATHKATHACFHLHLWDKRSILARLKAELTGTGGVLQPAIMTRTVNGVSAQTGVF